MAPPVPPTPSRSSKLLQALALGAALNSGSGGMPRRNAAEAASALAGQQAASRANTFSETNLGNGRTAWRSGPAATPNIPAATPSSQTPPPIPGSPEALARQQAKNRAIQKAEQNIMNQKTGFRQRLVDGGLLFVVRKVVPTIDILLNKLESAKPASQIKILKRIKSMLTIAQAGAGLIDGARIWLELFLATIETIIIPLILVVLLIPWLVIYSLFGKTLNGQFSVAIEKVTKIIDELLTQAENQLQKKTAKQSAVAQLEQLKGQPSA